MRNKFILPTFSKAVNQLKDLDGNIYTSVIIGTQEWIVENWRCTKYADGSDIPNIQENEYNDWFLPSIDELNAMYTNLKVHGVGGFEDFFYWSSSENNDIQAKEITFLTGYEGFASKTNTMRVRACRSFTDEIGAYSLRDIGPAGGLIFYISGTTYYEAAPSDQSAGKAWSNIIDTAIGTTGTAIGDGAQNTLDIIGQEGHIDSAAKLCDDLSLGGWANDEDGAYCAYDNDDDNIDLYGLLYNWYAVDNEKGLAYLEKNGVQELGWRISIYDDIDELASYLGGETIAGGKLKETGVVYWNSPNTGATNESAFSARGGGYRQEDGTFLSIKSMGIFHLIDEEVPAFSLFYNAVSLTYNSGLEKEGYSIRLVRDIS